MTSTFSPVKLILLLIAVPFVGTGGWMVFRAYQAFSSPRPDVMALFFHWMPGLVFSLAGAGLMVIVLFGKEVKPGVESPLTLRKRLLGIKPPEEQWRDGRISNNEMGGVIFAWIIMAFGTLLVAPVLWVGISRGYLGHTREYVGWCAAAIVPVYLSAKALYRTLRHRKFGTSICDILRRPGGSSAELGVRIRPETAELPEGEAHVELRCEKRETLGSHKHRHTVITPLWKDQKSIPIGAMGIGIQGTFTIPAELPEAGSGGIHWILEARSATPGINYFASFNLALKRSGN